MLRARFWPIYTDRPQMRLPLRNFDHSYRLVWTAHHFNVFEPSGNDIEYANAQCI